MPGGAVENSMKKYACYLLLHGFALLVLVVIGGCLDVQHTQPAPSSHETTATDAHQDDDFQEVRALQNDLAALNHYADIAEARQVAQTAVTYSHRLAEKYGLVRPAVLHNLLVRVGLKKRGLCYHWTEDLLKRLTALDLKTYQFHWGVAHRGSELREHNSVVITARRQAFDTGILLDPWRNSGDLYWSPVRTDRYPWKQRPPHEW
jgi:hypothetical protein